MNQNPSFTESGTSVNTMAVKYILRFYTLDRANEKTFTTRPILQEAIEKAQQCGLVGNKLLLADDGCEICDDEAFIYYIEQKAKFMIASSCTQWKEPVNKNY